MGGVSLLLIKHMHAWLIYKNKYANNTFLFTTRQINAYENK
jgi:hypothetical protein